MLVRLHGWWNFRRVVDLASATDIIVLLVERTLQNSEPLPNDLDFIFPLGICLVRQNQTDLGVCRVMRIPNSP